MFSTGTVNNLKHQINYIWSRLNSNPLFKIISWVFRLEFFPLTCLLLLYILVNGWMTFASSYKNYIFSDMDAYFNHAISIYNGHDKDVGNWVGFSPLYSRILAEFYSILKLFNIDKYFLEYILIQNILLSAFSGIALYAIAYKPTKSRLLGLVLTGFYLFSYAHLYFNAFVLSEPFTVPILIITCSLLLIWHGDFKVIFVALLLAICVGVRPSNGLLGLPFALYIWLYGFSFKTPLKKWFGQLWPSTIRAALFSVTFLLSIIIMIGENNRISDGKVKNLTSNSGYNFLIGQSQAHRIFSSWDGLTFVFSASSVAHHPEKGTLRTTIPLYDSPAFYKEGWKIIEAYPNLWIEHLGKYKYMFFDNLFPAVAEHPGFLLMDVFRYILFYTLLLCGLTYITLKEKDVPRSTIYFFYAAFFLPAASLYMYTVTHKYFFNFSYTTYILSTFGIYSSVKHVRKYKNLILIYLGVLILGTIVYWSYQYYAKVNIERNLIALISENKSQIENIDTPRDIQRTSTLYIDELEFYEHNELQHSRLGLLGFKSNFFIDVETEMSLSEDGTYTFTAFGDDGYQIWIDDHLFVRSNGPKSMADSKSRKTIKLGKGKHKIIIKMYQTYWASGLAVYYRREESRVKHGELIWEPMDGRGNPLGKNDQFTKFSAPIKESI